MRRLTLLLVLASTSFCASRLPVAFEPNRGQHPTADYIARTRDFYVALHSDRIQLDSRNTHITTFLSGARRQARPEPEQKLPGVVHYLGRFTNLPTYSHVRYRSVYPGIDALYYATDGRLEYDFLVAPGADAGRIRLRYDGASDLHLDSTGDLIADGLRQHRPVAYQEIDGRRYEVSSRYVLTGHTVTIALGLYDRAHALVIDPALTWATYFSISGASGTLGEGIAVDSSGNIFICGSVVDPATGYDAFIAKLTPDGSQVSFKAIFDPNNYNNQAHGIALDSTGNIYVVGQGDSATFFGTLLTNAFIYKINPAGTALIYGSPFGGSYGDIADAVAVDGFGNAYIAGITTSPDFPISTGAFQKTPGGGNSDAFLTKINATGTAISYSTFLGGNGDETAYGVAVDPSGNVWVTGQTSSTNYPLTSSALQSTLAGSSDAFVAAFSSTGSLVASTYLGGTGSEIAYAIAADSSGAYVTGETTSTDFPTVTAAQGAFGGGKGDIFVAKLNPTVSTLTYATYWGGTGEDAAYGIAVDSSGAAYVTGFTSSNDLPLSGAFQPTNGGAGNTVVLGLDASGAPVLSSYLGGSGSSTAVDYGNAAAVSCASGLVVTGITGSTNFPVTTGAAIANYSGASNGDAFVAKIGIGGIPTVSGVVNGASLTAGPIAPGSVASIVGTSLSGATVSVNGASVPILAATGSRIDFPLPNSTAAGAATATVTNGCGTTSPSTFQVVTAAPYVRLRSNGDAWASNQDKTDNSSKNPAKTGSLIAVQLTGIGPVDNLSKPTLPATATIGGWDATVQSISLIPGASGMAQATLTVPGLSPGTYAAVITVNGVASNEGAVYVQ